MHEYDSLFGLNTQAEVVAALDMLVDELIAETGADKIDLLGHSLGTALMQTYLNAHPARAAKIAHYVNIDGATAAAPPGGVSTLAIWGTGSPARQIVGAENVYFPNQTHVQVGDLGGVVRGAVRVPQRRAAGDDEHPARAPRPARRPRRALSAEPGRRRRDAAISSRSTAPPAHGWHPIPTPPTRSRARAAPSGRSRPSAASTTSS